MSVNLTGWQAGQFRVYTNYEIAHDGMNIHLGYKEQNGAIRTATPVLFSPPNAGGAPWIGAGTGFSYREVLQAFLEQAWELGMRPREFTGYEQEKGAIERHLADMRAIVGSKLKVQLP